MSASTSLSSPMLSAITMVTRNSGVEIQVPKSLSRQTESDVQIRDIARASGLRVRNVLLQDRWWHKDSGPMLGFLEDQRHPVALLRSHSGAYYIVDPRGGSKVRVDDKSVQGLSVDARMFAESLPTDVSRLWQIPRWAAGEVWADISFVILLALLITLLGMLVPQATAALVDVAIPEANLRMLLEIGLGLCAAVFGIAVLSVAQGIATVRFSIWVNAKAQSAIFCHVLLLTAPFFRRFTDGDLLDRLMAISEVSQEFNSTSIRSLLVGLTASLNLGLLFYYDPQLATVVLGLGLVVLLFTVLGFVSIHKYQKVLLDLQGSFKGFVFEVTSAVGKIRLAGAGDRILGLWLKRYARQVSLKLRVQQIEDSVDTLNYSVPLAGLILVYAVGGQSLIGSTAQASGLSLGIFLAFTTAMTTFLLGLTSLSTTALELLDMLAKFERIKPIIAAEKEIRVDAIDPGPLEGRVTLQDVSFGYDPKGPAILENLSIDIRPGEFLALVGPSGCGKSTIFRLLVGFERPDAGRVLFDGQDLNQLDLGAVRSQLGCVLQSAEVSAGPIMENIAGSSRVGIDEIWRAAEDAGLAEDIEQMPMGIHTMISEGGGNISGGQKQRLLIARALVKNPRILLLDEATSALDNNTQATVTASLKRRNVTRIAIAHRLSTIQDADRIIVLKSGVSEIGTFEALMEKSGLFASMMSKQQAG
ncbi:MAG: NHLP bacteriocin export ABC transporter permease/ATPase subunit [Arenicellales bacterium]